MVISDKWTITSQYKEDFAERMSENLSALRAKAGISQEAIAGLIGISRQTYYALETGRRDLTWSNFLSLMLFFDTNRNTHEMLRELRLYPVDFMRTMTD